MGRASPSPFEAVLAQIDLRGPAADERNAPRVAAMPSVGWYIPETAAAGSRTDDRPDGDWPATRYLADAPFPPGSDEAPSPAPPSLDPLEIAAELDLAGCPDIRSLRLRRRRFARINHPDKAEAALHVHATLRMTIANRLIDEEIARRRRLIPAAW